MGNKQTDKQTDFANQGDTISRQAAIDAIDEWIKAFRENGHKESAADACLIQNGIIQLPSAQPDLDSAYTEGYTQAEAKYRKMWDEMQSAQPEPQWTPCSIRPPESGLVLVTYTDGDVDIMVQPTAYREYDIVAWMPIEPYKEENNERA